MNDAAQKIELLLFYEGGTLSKKALKDALALDDGALVQALLACKDALTGRGVEVYESATDVSLRAAPHLAPFLVEYEKKTLSENLGAAAIEVLSVLLYRGASSQAEIDSIRGVNSTFSLRTLRMRGLVSKEENMYSITADTLAHLGVTSITSVPEYEAIRTKLLAFEEKNNA